MTEQQPTTPTELERAQQLAFNQWPKEKWVELEQALEAQASDYDKLVLCLLVISGGQ